MYEQTNQISNNNKTQKNKEESFEGDFIESIMFLNNREEGGWNGTEMTIEKGNNLIEKSVNLNFSPIISKGSEKRISLNI